MTASSVAAPPSRLLEADRTPEARGSARDGVRLLLSRDGEEEGRLFRELPSLLDDGDLLVVNESGTLPASLPAHGPAGPFRLNLSTRYGPELWLAEPRWSAALPGPLPLPDGSRLEVAGVPATVVARYPGIARLAFVRFDRAIEGALAHHGLPISYGYLREPAPLASYQTIFARVPGSAEMPSAGRPFSSEVLGKLRARGVRLARILLHCAVSSLEPGDIVTGAPPVLPEPYRVPRPTVEAIEATRRRGGRVVAVGTTVVRALESATERGTLRPSRGFTRRYLAPPQRSRSVDAILTGFHPAGSTHLDLLASVLGPSAVLRAYAAAGRGGYLAHEFGDVHLAFAACGAA